MSPPNLRCGGCGKFISEPADSYTPYGSYYDMEPPDPVLLCTKCVEEEKQRIRQTGHIFNHWLPASFEQELAKELGLVRIDGWWKKKNESDVGKDE